jgi:hypothetical protein
MASWNLDGASSGKTSESSRSTPRGRRRRDAAYTTETTAVAKRLIANHHARKTVSEFVGTPVIEVATCTKASEPAMGRA